MKPADLSPSQPPADSTLKPDEILTAEFAYTVQSAFQANEDRARVTSFYLVSVGSFIAAILSTQLFANSQPAVYWGFAGLFLFLAALALTTILQLIRLRKSWYESVQAMNQIKEYYVRHLPDLDAAFRWRNSTIPPRHRANSLSFYLVLEVGLFGAASFGAAYFFGLMALGVVSWGPAVALGAVFFGFEIWLYRKLLSR